jgi:release factor glutamine methyltransferase
MNYDPRQVYQPEADTFLVMSAAREDVRPGDRILEIGTGSGLIAEELGRTASVIATDINPHAVAAARDRGVDVVRTDLFAGICGSFDLVIFNPPYLPTRPEERIDDWLEYALDGGPAGRDVILRFARGVGRVLAPDGRVLLLVSSLTGLADVQEIFSGTGFSSHVTMEERVEDEILYVLRIKKPFPEKTVTGLS